MAQAHRLCYGRKMKVQTQELERAFHRLAAQARTVVPRLFVTLSLGPDTLFPEARDYAFCVPLPGRCDIVVSRKILTAHPLQRDALLCHELSHAMLCTLGREHTERECDAFAEEVFGSPVYYDEHDVQTFDPKNGRRPRPAHLPDGEKMKQPLQNPLGKKFSPQVRVVRMKHGDRRHIQNPETGLTLCNPRSTEKRNYTVFPVPDPDATVDCYRCLKLAAMNQERRGSPVKVRD